MNDKLIDISFQLILVVGILLIIAIRHLTIMVIKCIKQNIIAKFNKQSTQHGTTLNIDDFTYYDASERN